jgi:hypothetical protein
MALAAAIIKGLTIAIGSGVPLLRNWDKVSADAKTFTILGIGVLLVGTTLCGRAGILRERELQHKQPPAHAPTTKASRFALGFLMALLSGVLSAFVNLGYDFGNGLEQAMQKVAGTDLTWKATLIRWMPMYWGGITALLLVMGGRMLRSGAWRNYFAPGSGRDFAVASSMGGCISSRRFPMAWARFISAPSAPPSAGAPTSAWRLLWRRPSGSSRANGKACPDARSTPCLWASVCSWRGSACWLMRTACSNVCPWRTGCAVVAAPPAELAHGFTHPLFPTPALVGQ